MPITSRTIQIDPKVLKLLDLNAHYMRQEVFARLVDNLKEDGGLHGDTPLVWRLHDDATQQPVLDDAGGFIYEVISGNHRVKASIAAGLPQIDVCVVDEYLPPDKRRALQLSRNAVIGEDDAATLKLIYDSITDPGLRLYTGLDDRTLKLLDGVSVAALSEAALEFQTIALTFLPHEIDQVAAALEAAQKQAKAKGYWLASWDEYDQAMDALEIAGQAHNIKNTATALMIVLNVFMEHLEDLQAGYLTPDGDPRVKRQHVPLATLFGKLNIPAPLAAKIKKAQAKLGAPDAFAALDKLADLILSQAK
jgi:hypothetical protein